MDIKKVFSALFDSGYCANTENIVHLSAICAEQQELIDKLTRRLDDLEGGV